jgi:hydroxyacylglutathione hydrolase
MIKARYCFEAYELLVVQVLPETYGTYNYMLCHNGQAVLVDAGEAAPLCAVIQSEGLRLLDVLITHTHHDHVGGCRAIHERLGVQATSPGVEAKERTMLGTLCRSISTPGHMAVHKCYHFPQLGLLFSGDTLINGACGRLLGGIAEQLFDSLQRIKALPDETRIFGGHDYLEDNMNFAQAVEPDNADVKKRLELYQRDPASAIFVTLAEEKKTNPFLRVDSAEAFAELRRQKDLF